MNPPNAERIQTAPYMDRILPWGETCRVAESRIKKAGWRQAWMQRATSLRRANPMMDIHESAYQAMTEFPPSITDLEGDEPHLLSEDDKKFIAICREGLQLDLPKRAGVEKELDWIGANLKCARPDVLDAPSKYCLNFVIAARGDPAVERQFWANAWSKRLSPGDSKTRKGVVVQEDQVDTGVEESEDARRKRLFGASE